MSLKTYKRGKVRSGGREERRQERVRREGEARGRIREGVGKARRGSEKGEARGEGERVGGERVREGEARGGRRDAQGSPKVITNSDAKSISKTGAKGRQEDKGNANKTHNKVDRTCICAGPP